jgi:hypothetical protein
MLNPLNQLNIYLTKQLVDFLGVHTVNARESRKKETIRRILDVAARVFAEISYQGGRSTTIIIRTQSHSNIGLLSMIPNLAPIRLMLGVIGFFNLPMDLFTMMVLVNRSESVSSDSKTTTKLRELPD